LDDGWPSETHLVYPNRHNGKFTSKIKIGPQSKIVQRVCCTAIQNLQFYVCFKDAFPDPALKVKFNRDAIYHAAADEGLKCIAQRVQTDLNYAEIIGSLCSPRIGHLRGDIKEAAISSVPGHYSLSHLTRTDDINSLLLDDAYLYPVDLKTRKIQNNRPYCHPAIVSIMKTKLFYGRLSIGFRHHEEFTSSIKEGPQASEKEVPASMVALIATAIYAAISEFLTGCSKPEFSVTTYRDAFQRHMNTLDYIKERKITAYHTLMASLYNECIDETRAHTNSIVKSIDLDAMATSVD